MRRYDDPVEVRRGQVSGVEAPEQFLWRGRLWKVRSVLAHWVETGAWWQSAPARAALGEEPAGAGLAVGDAPAVGDLLAERELWRVEAGAGAPTTAGVFELCFDWADGRWQLLGCVD